jgi:hypothetical protein
MTVKKAARDKRTDTFAKRQIGADLGHVWAHGSKERPELEKREALRTRENKRRRKHALLKIGQRHGLHRHDFAMRLSIHQRIPNAAR